MGLDADRGPPNRGAGPEVARVGTDRGDALVVREEPLVIEVGEHTVLTMRTPGHDEDLALGFLLAEGVLGSIDDVTRLEARSRAAAGGASPVDAVRVHVAPGREPGPAARAVLARAHAIRASCGLCGLVSAEGLTRHLRPLRPAWPRVSLDALGRMAEAMRAAQAVFAATGGAHAAAVFDAAAFGPEPAPPAEAGTPPHGTSRSEVAHSRGSARSARPRATDPEPAPPAQSGRSAPEATPPAESARGARHPWAVREDVGRHNALDKALGRCARDRRDLARAAVVLSGRGGYELVLKALRMGVPIVASVSAPTSLAVELAVEHGQTLVGFLRDGGGRVYADDGRIAGAATAPER